MPKDDEHQLTLCRLEWELKQRITLAEQITQSEALSGQNIEDVRKMQELLGRLRSCMTTVVESLKPATAELSSQEETGDEQDASQTSREEKDEAMETEDNPSKD